MYRQVLFRALGVAAALAGIFLLYRVFQRYDLAEVLSVLASVQPVRIALALLLTSISYGCVATLEWLAVTYGGHPIALRRVAFAAVAAIGIGRTVGLAALSSGAVRYRMYSRAGLTLTGVGKIIVFSGLSVASGFAAVGGAALLWRGEILAQLLDLSTVAIRGLGVCLLVYLACYLTLCAAVRRPIRVGRHRLRLPSITLACGQVAFSSANFLSIGGVLYVALSGFTEVGYPFATMLYLGGDLSAAVGHVPGGWGVLEYIVTTALDGGAVLSGVILFRAIYYLVPCGAGLLVFLVDELRHRRWAAAGGDEERARHPGRQGGAIAASGRPNRE